MKLTTDNRPPNIQVPLEDVQDIADMRGLPAQLLADHGIRIANADAERPGWIEIPYPHLTGVWYSRFRNTADTGHKYHTPRGEVGHLYNPLHLGPNADEVWVAEGEFDTLALIACGVPAVGVSGVSAFKPDWGPLYDEARVVIAFDPDEPGMMAANKLATNMISVLRYRESNVQVFEWPPEVVVAIGGKADWNEWYRHDGQGMREYLLAWRKEWGLL